MHFALIRYGWSQPDESIYQNADIDERASFVSRTIHLWHSSQLYAQSQRIGLRSRQCQPLAAHFAIIYFCRFSLILFAMACWCGRHLQSTDAFLLGITA